MRHEDFKTNYFQAWSCSDVTYKWREKLFVLGRSRSVTTCSSRQLQRNDIWLETALNKVCWERQWFAFHTEKHSLEFLSGVRCISYVYLSWYSSLWFVQQKKSNFIFSTLFIFFYALCCSTFTKFSLSTLPLTTPQAEKKYCKVGSSEMLLCCGKSGCNLEYGVWSRECVQEAL